MKISKHDSQGRAHHDLIDRISILIAGVCYSLVDENGMLTLRAEDGTLSIEPRVSNVIVIRTTG